MQKLLSLFAVAALASSPAFAGSAGEPVGDFAPETPAPAALQSSPDWTGFYGGIQLGYANVDTNAGSDDDDFIGGLTAGYDHDLGDWVIGASLDYDFTDIRIAGTTTDLEQIFRAKVRGGYKIGNGLLYATAGYANADTNNAGNEDGYFIGGGYEYLVSDHFSIGGEVLYHEFNNFDSTSTDVEATTVQVRGTFRF